MGNENKYIFDLDSFEKKEIPAEKIEERRKAHKKGRSQALAVLLIFVLFVCVGMFFGIKALVKNVFLKDSPTQPSITKQEPLEEPSDSLLDDLLGGEDEVVVSTPSPEDLAPSEEELFEEAVRAYVQSIPLEDQVAGLFIVTPEQLTGVSKATKAGDGTKTALEQYAVGGILYTSSNMTDPKQFKELTEGTKNLSRYPIFLTVDEELGNSCFPKAMKAAETMTPQAIGENGDISIAKTEEEKIAANLEQYGIDLNLGVTADVYTGGDESVKAKCYSTDANVVGDMASMSIEALTNYGIKAGVKFFPGQGSASADPANAIAGSERTKEQLCECEFAAFKKAIDSGASMVVVSHMAANNVTGEPIPCSQSKVIMTDILRMEMEYDDLVIITDAFTKAAISSYYDSASASITSIKAGADMILSPENFKEAYTAVLEAVGNGVIARERVEDSLVRIYKVKFKGMTSEQVNSLIPSY